MYIHLQIKIYSNMLLGNICIKSLIIWECLIMIIYHKLKLWEPLNDSCHEATVLHCLRCFRDSWVPPWFTYKQTVYSGVWRILFRWPWDTGLMKDYYEVDIIELLLVENKWLDTRTQSNNGGYVLLHSLFISSRQSHQPGPRSIEKCVQCI